MLETRALVVDDDETILKLFGLALRQTVRHVDQEASARRAIELFATHRHPIVVLDLVMPELDGIEVLEQIHRIEPRAQVIIVTGHPSVDNAIRALNLHAFRYLRKPIVLRELHQVVAEAWTRYQHPDDAAAPDEVAIEALYDQVSTLSAALERTPDDPALRAAYRDGIAHLRSAQTAEAELATRVFHARLPLKKGAGYASIEAARLMLGRDKSSA
jgi:DNA-binding NtrC family response regulator